VNGEVVNYQIRSDIARIRDGKPVKYETPRGSRVALDINPIARLWLSDISRPLLITEGIRKADAAVSKGLCCLGLSGVWNWRGRVDGQAAAALPEWDVIPLKGRLAYVCFDNDVMQKPQVRLALRRLVEFLKLKGADARIIYLPVRDGGAKLGLDDYFAEGHGVDDLLQFATTEIKNEEPEEVESIYAATDGGLIYQKPTAHGRVPVPITNFNAQITADVMLDDGTETSRLFEIEASLRGAKGSVSRGSVPSSRFSSMQWGTELLGARAIIYPGMTEHARCAVQSLSPDIVERLEFAHTGWRNFGGEWRYLHSGGAVGKTGAHPAAVRLPNALRHFELPEPPQGEGRREALRCSLQALEIAPLDVTAPIIGAAYAAVLGGNDFSIHVAGPTGVGKSELAAIVQQHFGARFDARHLPAAWSSTSNANEAVAHVMKDAACVVDDFAPSGTSQDVARYNRDADRLFRAQGNNAGRQRMRSDTTLRAAKSPRGVIVSTGEDVPRGESVRARTLITEISKDTINWEKLSQSQVDATSGQYAAAMSAHLQQLASNYDDIVRRAGEELTKLRNEANRLLIGHKRSPSIVAQLMRGWDYFLESALACNALTASGAADYRKRIWVALIEAAKRQTGHQVTQEPAARFIELLNAALSSKRAHIANKFGDAPLVSVGDVRVSQKAFGWMEDLGENWHAQGDRMGWVDECDVYLQPEAAFTVAQRMAAGISDNFSISIQTMWKRLHEGGFLASTDKVRGTLKVRRKLEGKTQSVIHIRLDKFIDLSTIDDEPDISDMNEAQDGLNV
jgi:hypothetical protein